MSTARSQNRRKGNLGQKLLKQYLEGQRWTVHEAKAALIRKGPLIFTQTNDLWGCIDLAAFHAEYGWWFIQVTYGGDVSARKHKIEVYQWPKHEQGGRISVVEVVERQNLINARRTDRFGRIYDLVQRTGDVHTQTWILRDEAIQLK